MLKAILKTIKINHYIKNLVVFIPLIFSMNIFNIKLDIKAFYIFVAFCFISSAVYILNDLIDLENDKKHPIKSKRPIASGKISIPIVILMFIILTSLSVFISIKINLYCFIAIISYLILNVLYSIRLKKIFLIDIASIALGFILRILAGCFAINVIPSALVILLTFFISNLFTCIKRKMEITLTENKDNARPAIKNLDSNTINQFIIINAVLSIAFYITYVLDSTTIQRAGSPYLYLTVIPFTLIIYRLILLVNLKVGNDDPIVYFEKDKTIKYLFLLYFIVLISVLIFLK